MMICQYGFKKWFIGNDIRDILMNDADISRIVGEHIYPLIAPEGTQDPFIVYSRVKYSKEVTKQAIVSDECIVTILVLSSDYDEAIILASLIDDALTGQHTTVNGEVFTAQLYDSEELYEDYKFVQSLSFKIK